MSIVLLLVTPLLLQNCVTGKPKESFKSLESKLNLILESQNLERELIQSALHRKDEHGIKVQQTTEASSEEMEQIDQENFGRKETSSFGLGSRRVLQKLEENSKKMDAMVMFFADLKTVLDEAVKSQTKELELTSQVDELREEMQYLRLVSQSVNSFVC